MADQLPTNSYDIFTQGQLGSAQNTYDFWANQFSKFNPTPAQVQPVNTAPGFQQAGQNTMQELNSLTNGGQSAGGADLTRMQRNLGNAETSMGLKQNLRNDENAMNQNYGLNLQGGEGAFGRMGKLAGIQGKVNEMPVEQMGQNFATEDTINSMENAYNNSKGDFFDSLLGGLGKIGGTLAGRLFQDNPKPYVPQAYSNEETYNMME